MKLVRLYEEILRENQAEACVAKFGKELFDPELSVKGEPSEIEPNTDIENYYLFQIGSFTASKHGKFIKPEFVSAMEDLKKCMSSYPEILEPEGTAYRGESFTLTELLTQYEDITDDLDKGGEFNFTYKPKSVIQSWTASEDVAEGFAKVPMSLTEAIRDYKKAKDDPQALANFVKEIYPKMGEIRCPIVMRLNTSPDDFLFKAKYFRFLSEFEDELELLRFNDKPKIVTAVIIEVLFKPVYGILTAVRQYEAQSRQ